MSVKELVVVPKQKFDSLNNSKDNPKEVKSVGCQTEEGSSQVETPVNKNEDSADAETSTNEMTQLIKEGILGQLQRRPLQKRRKTIYWLTY